MKLVGITGGIGSGKTTVCRIFELLCVPVFYADDEAKKLYDDAKIRSKVVRLFGRKVLGADKKIDKTKLAEIVFSDKASLSKLNALIHPEVGRRFKAWKKKQKGHMYVIKEAAIMIESGSHKSLDYLISVNSPKDLKIKRLLNRNISDTSEIERRMKEQISDAKRARYSDAIILNDDKNSLIEQVLKLHKKISG